MIEILFLLNRILASLRGPDKMIIVFWNNKINSIKTLLGLTILLVFSNGAIAAGCYESSIQSPTPFMGNDGEAGFEKKI